MLTLIRLPLSLLPLNPPPPPTAQDQVALLIKDIRVHLLDAKRGELLREGLKVAIFGPPNAGKVRLPPNPYFPQIFVPNSPRSAVS